MWWLWSALQWTLPKKVFIDCLHFFIYLHIFTIFFPIFSVWILVFQKPPLQILHFLIFLITWVYQRYSVVHQKMWRKIRVQRKYNNLSISHKKCSFNMKCPKISKKNIFEQEMIICLLIEEDVVMFQFAAGLLIHSALK